MYYSRAGVGLSPGITSRPSASASVLDVRQGSRFYPRQSQSLAPAGDIDIDIDIEPCRVGSRSSCELRAVYGSATQAPNTRSHEASHEGKKERERTASCLGDLAAHTRIPYFPGVELSLTADPTSGSCSGSAMLRQDGRPAARAPLLPRAGAGAGALFPHRPLPAWARALEVRPAMARGPN